MSDSRPPQAGPDLVWTWLFPATYAVHILEEYWTDFPEWLSRTFGTSFSEDAFWMINGVGLALFFVAAVLIHGGGPRFVRVVPVLSAIVLGNGSTHVVATLLTRTFSPGTFSGALLWIPLGAYGLRWSWQRLGRRGVVLGVISGALVLLLVFLLATASRQSRYATPPRASLVA